MKMKIISVFAITLCVCLLFTGCGEQVVSLLNGENETIEYKIENGEAAVISVPNKSTVTVIDIPDEYDGVPVTKIADYSAFNLEYVTEINIGKNVKEIGVWSMTNNQHVTAFNVDSENPYFCSVDGIIYTKDMKIIVYCPATYEGEFVIPDTVETIRSKSFYKCSLITSITIPNSVKTIEEKSFFRCGGLTEITLAKGIEVIGKDAFGYCTGLTEINIPASIKQIDEYAFYNCTSLLTVNVDANENDLTLGNKWYPTNNGLDIDGLEIVWKK